MKRMRFFLTTLIGLACIATPLMATVPNVAISQGSAALDGSVAQLRQIGTRLAMAVLNRDTETLLGYDRENLRGDDRLSLQDKKSDLYCLLFDRTCNANGRPSVSDILSRSKRLGVEVQVLRARDRPLHGWLLFFDSTTITQTQLRSASYRCQHSNEIASWLFKLEGKRWVAANPLFDSETDTLCSPR